MAFLYDMMANGYHLIIGYILPFLFVLSIVVFIHEFGHFQVGRWCGVGVKAFSIGFGPELVGWNDRHGTRWKICIVPLGGYVKFAGDMNAASIPDQNNIEQMDEAEKSVSFHHKAVWKRTAIVAAGPIANFILAIAIFAGLTYFHGRYILLPKIEQVQAGSPAEKAGFEAGDLILSINDKAINSFSDMQALVSASAGTELGFRVERRNSEVRLQATPDLKEVKTPFGTHRIGILGIQGSRNPSDQRLETYNLPQSLYSGAEQSLDVVTRTFDYLGKLVMGRESADQLSGPIRIAQISGQVATMSGINGLINLIAILSVSIGLINLFPIPMLDGGHLMFYAIEAVRGRPLSPKAQEYGFRIGFALVIMLMLFSTWNDISHLRFGGV